MQDKLADYMNRLLDLGVYGFRVDAVKHIATADVAAIKAATEEASKAFYPIAEKMYQQANPQGGQQPGPDMGGAQAGSAGSDPNVVDADYEVVDDDNQK